MGVTENPAKFRFEQKTTFRFLLKQNGNLNDILFPAKLEPEIQNSTEPDFATIPGSAGKSVSGHTLHPQQSFYRFLVQ